MDHQLSGSNVCVVCRKYIKKGDRIGFENIHSGECERKWNSWSREQRINKIIANSKVPRDLRQYRRA